MTCAVKSSSSSDNPGGEGGSSSGSKSSGGSSSSSLSSSGGSNRESSSSSKAGAGGSSSSSSGSSQAGSSSAGSSSSSSSSGNGGSAGKPSGGGSAGGSAGGGSGGASSSSSSANVPNTCTQDSQCSNGHCVNNACVCWDSNAKVCNGVCTDVKYNNNACGECGKTCPPSAPRCDYGNCKCDSPPCAGGSAAGGSSSSSSSAGIGGAGNGGSSSSSANSGGAGASGGSSSSSTSNGGTVTVPPITNGSDGWASRYWDCCKPSCGWSENAGGKPVASCSQDNAKMSDFKAQSACQGGSAYVCWDMAPWAVSDNLAYGFAAFNGVPCGTCFQIQFTGGTHNGKAESCKALNGKTMFVQVTNIGGIGSGQFDIMVPGGGVGDFDACTKQWGTSDLGARYGGFLSACNGDKSCVQNKCNTVFASKPTLKAACNWFVDWYGAADNPTLKYQKVNCPSELTAKSGM
jgi:hypothetical protein